MAVGTRVKMLEKIRVLDLSRVMSGPFCSRMLSDLGAEVIKLESTHGDPMRYQPPLIGGFGSYFTQFNVGKKSLAMNLRHPDGVKLIKRLVPLCDVIIENFRPGTLNEMGLAYSVLKESNPKIILCSISGFGQDGPEAKRLAYTDIVQAYCGMDYMAGRMLGPDADPPGMPYSFGDSYAALNAAVAILAALFHRESTGEGQAIDISMLDCLLAANDSALQKFIFSEGQMDTPGASFRPPIRFRDGFMAVSLNLQFDRMCQAIGHPELPKDPRYKVLEERYKPENFSAYLATIKEWSRGKTVKEASEIFETYDIPFSKVNSLNEVVNSPVVSYRNMIVDVELPDFGPILVVNTPFKFSETSTRPQGPPPWLGEHNKELLSRLLKMTDEEIEALNRQGILVEQKEPPTTA